ncbi:hypothetical protein HJFPF1_03796 [Paramyrothecium foliicola]|nr:hypothetical protein HJFPF1_03796 [Paramyrothecium foliicola]
MKFLFSLALLVAAGVSAQKSDCDAQYIVDQCLTTENGKVEACKPADWDCLCAAHEAVATCWNNCPKEPGASPAQQQVTIMCQNASLYGTKAQASKTAAVSGSQTSAAAAAATTDSDDENAEETSTTASPSGPTQSADSPEGTGAAANLARNTGGLLLAVAGVVAAML